MITDSTQWKELEQLANTARSMSLRTCFEQDPNRAAKYTVDQCGIYLDYSKNLINDEVMASLISMLEASGIDAWRRDMFSGKPINHTEKRAVGHVALRALSKTSMYMDGNEVMFLVRKELSKMRVFVESVRRGRWVGHTGKTIHTIVNIGIGGSDLGPKMVTEALQPYCAGNLTAHYVSNVDEAQLKQTLDVCDPERTLFIICSKTFTTQETLNNANRARQWFLKNGGNLNVVRKHFVAVTSNQEEANKFGIHPDQQFDMWDWVGGRFSLWSTIGLSTALMIGTERFVELLRGAEAMDNHFYEAPLAQNIPVITALLAIWYNNFLKADSHAVIPYCHYLRLLPEYMQQLEMESNGKLATRSGEPLTHATSPVLWGTAGTNGQHAYFQMLHQGTQLVSKDFILVRDNPHSSDHSNVLLLSNGVAQMEALMMGKTKEEAERELRLDGLSDADITALLPYKVFPGNQPSTAILLDKADPKSVGALIAMYEHKTFVQSIVWDINAFDQWGVEYGKQLAKAIQREIEEGRSIGASHDGSTAAIMRKLFVKA